MQGDSRLKRAELRRVAVVRVRLTIEEEAELVRRAERAGLSVSEYVRRAVLEGSSPAWGRARRGLPTAACAAA